MADPLLTRTIVTRVLFEQAKIANVLVDWFEVAEQELGSTASDFRISFED